MMMSRAAVRCLRLTALAAAFGCTVLQAADSKSGPLARELSQLLTDRKLEAIAAADPADPGRFVAALFFQNVQLLVVSGRTDSPLALQQWVENGAFADVYAALQGAAAAGKLFVHDLGADGLHATGSETVDVVYEEVVNQTVIGGSGKRDMSEKAYADKVAQLDDRYSHMLTVLIAQARMP